ncbi:MAG: nitronate monooxygenase, partial [Ruminiclostridium sp.]|nr:nitronate monooxygenase [Ruminiclostridium sp.]
MNTKITELLGIKYPILQGGMAWIAESSLAAAVSNAGGAGIIAGGSAPAELIKEEIHKAKALTDKPFGVNIMLMAPNADDLAQLVIDEKIPFITTGAGNPGKYMEKWLEAGIKVIPVVPSVALAKRMERAGAAAVIAEGTESGGHIGENTTMCLVPQVVDAVSIPVIAAGGIADGRGIAASFMLGAEGVQVGTRFLACEECKIHPTYKELVIDAKDTDSVVTGRYTGHPCRNVKTKFAKRLATGEKDGTLTPDEFEQLTVGALRKAVQDGNLDEGSFL